MSLPSSSSGSQDHGGKASGNVGDDDDEDEEFYDTDPLPIIGRCRAMYPFEGKTNHNKSFLNIFDNNGFISSLE